jgi:hypothetical protein
VKNEKEIINNFAYLPIVFAWNFIVYNSPCKDGKWRKIK